MEDEIWAGLTDSEKEAYQRIDSLLDHPGWKILTRDLKEVMEATQAQIENAPSWDSYVYARGTRDALNLLLQVRERVIAQLAVAVQERQLEEEAEHLDAFA